MRARSWTVVAGIAIGALALGGCVIGVEGYEAVEQEEHVFAVSGVPDVDLSTFDGRIEVRGWDRPEVQDVDGDVAVNTEDGSIHVSGVLAGLEASTDDGRIVIGAVPGSVMSGDWDLHAEDGRVTVDLPRDFGALLDLATDDGRIRVDDRFGGNAERGADALRRVIGGGGFVLRVRTDDGSIRVGAS